MQPYWMKIDAPVFGSMSAEVMVLTDVLRTIVVLTALTGPAIASRAATYPTVAIVDYVYGCMKANGQTRDALENCSCSIDVIASIVPYERYEAAEVFRSLGLQTGERGVLFRQSALAKSATSELRRAQAEADVRCF